MTVDYWLCGMCGVQLMTPDQFNAGKLPGIRRWEDPRNHKGLIAVRCAQCAHLPYLLEEGQPYRVDLIGEDDIPILTSCNSEYNYYPLGIGHLLEAYVTNPSEQWIEQLRSEPIEIGFLVEENVNLIVVAYRHGEKKFNLTPYSWPAQREWFRAVSPPAEITSDADRKFAVAFVDTKGGKYRVVRQMKMSQEFAQQFHEAIHAHIERGAPDWGKYRRRVEGLGSLLFENKVEGLLTARSILE
jgi:hypothetical protein